MRIKDWFKPKSKLSDINLEELKKHKEINEKLLFHYFKISISRLNNEKDDKLKERINKLGEEIMSIVLGQLYTTDSAKYKEGKDVYYVYHNTLNKNVNIQLEQETEDIFSFIIKFSDQTVKDVKKMGEKAFHTHNIKPKKLESYFFSAHQSLIAIKILPQIELGLVGIFNIKLHKGMHQYSFGKDGLIVKEFDGVQFLSYYLEKRIRLYKKFPEIDSLLFGMGLKKFLKWILEKRDKDEHMKKYCKEIDKLIKKYKIELK